MNATHRKGTVLTLVIVAIGLMAVVMSVMTEGANTMLFQADAAYCKAVERNLTASALAWSRSQVAAADAIAADNPIMLDCHRLSDQRPALTVQFTQMGESTANVRIATSCRKGRQRLEKEREYVIVRP